MARRADHSRKELTELVLASAIGIVEKDGINALTTRKIASEIGYSPGSIYNVFANLDSLIGHVNTRTMQMLNASLDRVELTGEGISDGKQILQLYLSFISQNPMLWAANIKHGSREDIQQPAQYLQELDEAFAKVEAAIRPLFGDQPRKNAWIAARVLWASLQGIVSIPSTARILADSVMTTEEMAENLVDNYLGGI